MLRFAVISVLLVIAVPLAFMVLAANEEAIGIQDIGISFYALCACVVLYSGIQVARLSVRAEKSLVRIPFYCFCYIWLGVVPLYQALVGVFPRISYISASELANTYLIIVAGLVSYEVGHLLSRLRHSRRTSGIRPLVIGSGVFLVATIGAAVLIVVIGFFLNDPALLFSTRAEFGAGLSESGGVMGKQLQNSLLRVPIVVLVVAALWRFRLAEGKERALLRILLILMIPLALISNFPLAVSRTWLGTMVVSIVMVLALTGKRELSYFGAGLILALLLIYPLGTYLRSPQAMTDLPVGEALIGTYTTGSFDVFAQIANTVYFVQTSESAITYGYQLLGPIFFWVPRAMWADKPVGTGQYIGEHIGLDFVNISAPLWSEGMINFGIFGVVAFFVLYGYLSRRLDLVLSAGKGMSLPALLGVFFSGFQLILLRGDLITAAVIFLPILLLTGLLALMGRRLQ